jgi:hypothetical protein
LEHKYAAVFFHLKTAAQREGAALEREVLGENPSQLCRSTHALLQSLETRQEGARVTQEDYREVIELLREAVSSPEYQAPKTTLDRECKSLIQHLCWERFAGVTMKEHIPEAVELFLGAPFDVEGLTLQELPARLTLLHAQIARGKEIHGKPKLALMKQQLKGAVGVDSDPQTHSNVPHVRRFFHLGDRLITSLRYGSPTKEGTALLSRRGHRGVEPANATIADDYRGYLDQSASLGQHILYANLQRRGREGKFLDGEHDRALAIRKLEDEYSGCFHFLSIPYDNFDKYLRLEEETKVFKDRLIDDVLGGQPDAADGNAFLLPQTLRDADQVELQNDLSTILESVHSLFFQGNPLDRNDRLTCYLIFSSFLKRYVMQKCQIDALVSACKDNQDRGSVSAAIDELIDLFLLGEENDPRRLRDLCLQLFAPAILIKKQPVLKDRLELLHKVALRLAQLGDKKALQTRMNERPDLFPPITQVEYPVAVTV